MADTASLFTTGDVVLANPKESAALFAIVVILSVVLENVFGAFRENRSRFIKLLFLQISEEIMIVGVIGLFFVFVTQSIDNMPTRWLLLFRWIQTVLFFLMTFFILGVVSCAFLSHQLIAWFRSEELAARTLEEEQRSEALSPRGGASGRRGGRHEEEEERRRSRSVAESGRTTVLRPEGISLSALQRLYFIARAVFVGHLGAIEDKVRADFRAVAGSKASRDRTARQRSLARSRSGRGAAAGDEDDKRGGGQTVDDLLADLVEPAYIAEIRDVSLVEYLQARAKDTIVKFTDITWQCWFSIIFLTSFNSVRMFVLPGKLQSKPTDEYTVDDRVLNVMTYIFIIGWIPTCIFAAMCVRLCYNTRRYLLAAEHRLTERGGDEGGGVGEDGKLLTMPTEQHPGGIAPRMKIGGTSVWLPPAELTAALTGRSTEDPSRNLLRGHRSFTMHAIKVPSLLAQLYVSMFIVGMWGQISLTFGARQVFAVPLALAPIVVSTLLTPVAILCVTLLTSISSRTDEETVLALARKRAALASGATEEEAEEAAMNGGGGGGEQSKATSELAAVEALQRATSVTEGAPAAETSALLEKLDRLETLVASGALAAAAVPTTASTADNGGSGGTARKGAMDQATHNEMLQLRSRARFLEDLCVSYGLPIVHNNGDSNGSGSPGGGGAPEQSIASVVAALSKMQEQMSKVQEQQQQILATAGTATRPGAQSSSTYSLQGAGTDGDMQRQDTSALEAVLQSRRVAGVGRGSPGVSTTPSFVQPTRNQTRDIARVRAPNRANTSSSLI